MRAEMQELRQHLNLAATKELQQKAAAKALKNNKQPNLKSRENLPAFLFKEIVLMQQARLLF